ncbi:hypothetical protein E8E14_007202 [Neopestalotiopsis sp. 37M]|nr:hypothetical protein E8E14_007202 [Neopestalotiopsis sp. 37M]
MAATKVISASKDKVELHMGNEKDSEDAHGMDTTLVIEERHVTRKIDLHLLPLMLGAYMLQFLDKTALGYTAIFGIQESLSINGVQYSWASSAFYFGYLVASYPTSLCFVHFPIAKLLSISFIIWAVVLACHGAASGFASLLVLRILLGMLESTISPGLSLMTAIWYKRSEHALRHGIWFAGNCIASIFGGVLTYGIGHINSSIESWRWIFIILGLITFAYGIVFFFLLPSSPTQARFLTPAEAQVAVQRTQAEMRTKKTNAWSRDQALEAITDPKSWLLFIYSLASSIPNGGLTSFGGIVVKGFGFSTLDTLLVSIPAYIFTLIWLAISTMVSWKVKHARCFTIAFLQLISIAGCLLVSQVSSSHKMTRLAGIWLFGAFSAGFPIVLSLTASNISGYTKKTTVNALVFLGYCTGNILGPFFFFSREYPSYPSAWNAIMISLGVAYASILVLRYLMVYQNRSRGQALSPEDENEDVDFDETPDETDLHDRRFKYVL